jgi:hypothetical protein
MNSRDLINAFQDHIITLIALIALAATFALPLAGMLAWASPIVGHDTNFTDTFKVLFGSGMVLSAGTCLVKHWWLKSS